MKVIWLLLWMSIGMYAASEKFFMVQFGKFTLQESAKAQKLWQKLKNEGIESELYEDKQHNIIVLQSKKPLSHKDIDHLPVTLHELQLFPLSTVRKNGVTSGKKDCSCDLLFGENDILVHLMEEGLDFRQKLAQTKARYLSLQKESISHTGLSVNLEAQRALERERNGFTAEIAWNMLNNGYFGSRSEAERKSGEKSISFERMTQSMIEDYSRVSTYEIDDIKHYITYIFAKRKEKQLRTYLSRADKKLQKGLITKWEYNKIAVLYQKSKMEVDYLSHNCGKPFSRKYASLIDHIESITLLDTTHIRDYTLQNAPTLKMEKEREKLLTHTKEWQEKVKAEFYLGRKEYTFINRDETLAGVEIKIPFDSFSQNDELKKLEKMYSGWKRKSIEMLLQKEVDHLIEELGAYKEQINTIKKEIGHYKMQRALGKSSLEQISGSGQQRDLKISLDLIDLEKELWLKRADILNALLKLQYLSGIRVL